MFYLIWKFSSCVSVQRLVQVSAMHITTARRVECHRINWFPCSYKVRLHDLISLVVFVLKVVGVVIVRRIVCLLLSY
jgi:hypothetical protein